VGQQIVNESSQHQPRDDRYDFAQMLNDLADDATVHYPPEKRPWTVRRSTRARAYLRVLLAAPGFRCLMLYRIARFARRSIPVIGRATSAFIFWFQRHWYNCAIASTAHINGGVILPHPTGIVIGRAATIGPHTWIFQHVTIGGAPGKGGMPTIGHNCRIYTGAVIAGPVQVGDHVNVTANAVVSFDVPSGSTVRAARAVIINGADITCTED
jgi:serine O-acetyltransferase